MDIPALALGAEALFLAGGGLAGGFLVVFPFALALALELGGLAGVYALAADTDGIDGSEDNAGVFVTPDSLAGLGRARARTLLEANDSYEFFREQNALLVTKTTHTNVNDLRILLLL